MLDQELLIYPIIAIVVVLAMVIILAWFINRKADSANNRIDQLHFEPSPRMAENQSRISGYKKRMDELEQMTPSKKGCPEWMALAKRIADATGEPTKD